jgi:transcriptional regulator with XRE-family HTH domain
MFCFLKWCDIGKFTPVNNLFAQMMTFAERLCKIHSEKGFSKIEFGRLTGVHHAQIGRYENKGAHPSTDVLAKLANALDVSAIYLLKGDKENLVENTLTDKELLSQFRAVEQMPEVEKTLVKKVIDALITKSKLKQLAI